MIGFAGGLMFSVVVFDLLPECIEKWNLINTIFAALLGIIIIATSDLFLSKKRFFSNEYSKVAILTAIGLMLHNFPEGIIMGCGFFAGSSLGFKMCILIAVHDIPEGMAVSAPMVASKVDKLKTFGYTAITALPTTIGAAIGLYIGSISEGVIGLSLGLASGIMLYVVCGKMLPQAMKLWEGIATTLAVLMGFFVGLIMCYVL